ncbi:MAG: hypothetical protein LBL98_01335 [Ruminococcus sp.]|jgi:hypothetical protein|nr:hypothetical protein [Ruminococcus sp.]
MGLLKKVALYKAGKTLKSSVGDILSTLSSYFLSDFEGEYELKNGSFVVVKSVGTPENPSVNFSVRRKSSGERARDIIIRSIAISVGITLISYAVRKGISKHRR